MSVRIHKNTAKVDCRWAIGLLFAEGIAYVTKIENYPEKCFYPESGKEPLYFESKGTADDYAFGILLNGYPAVVMEAPRAIIINSTKKSRNPKNSYINPKNRHYKRVYKQIIIFK